MSYIDCFNGDADGICALTQIRLRNPVQSELVTGVKRDINLLDRVSAATGDYVTVLDVSLEKNRVGLERVLSQGADVFYCDHHFSGEIPEHPSLRSLINTAPDVCTSLLVNQTLKGRFLEWAVVGTFGDNLARSATGLAKPLAISDKELERLQCLGIYLNYNGYGSQLEDLYFYPADLFRTTSQYESAFTFMAEEPDIFSTLEVGYHSDMQQVDSVKPFFERAHVAAFELPNEPWARRVSGVFANELANRMPDRAHAILTECADSQFTVSVRAPLHNKRGAEKVCQQFPTGGGRAAAAGINQLAADQVSRFVDVFSAFYQS